jgi:hypothetical protein
MSGASNMLKLIALTGSSAPESFDLRLNPTEIKSLISMKAALAT